MQTIVFPSEKLFNLFLFKLLWPTVQLCIFLTIYFFLSLGHAGRGLGIHFLLNDLYKGLFCRTKVSLTFAVA